MVYGGWKKRQGDGKQKYTELLAKAFFFMWFFFGGGVQKYTVVPIRKIMRTDHFCLSLWKSSFFLKNHYYPLFWPHLCNFFRTPEILMSICCRGLTTLLKKQQCQKINDTRNICTSSSITSSIIFLKMFYGCLKWMIIFQVSWAL